MSKILVLYVFHEFNKNVDIFFNNCIFKNDEIDFLIICNDINYKFNLPDFVMTLSRKNIGRDFGGWSDGLLQDNLYKKYDKFIFANSTITGPFLKHDFDGKWTDIFINELKGNIKLFGCTINNAYFSHVQSYVFSTDKETLEFLIEKNVFTITDYLESAQKAQDNEINMSKVIIKNGWNIGCLLKCYKDFDFTFKNKPIKDYKLYGDIMFQKYRNILWNEYDIIFIKSNRM
tara:strand:+ start:14173 stop:14865 length:693 start_codon:yes stop_codon:yes gene_type:complete